MSTTRSFKGDGTGRLILDATPVAIERVAVDGTEVPNCYSISSGHDPSDILLRPHASNDGVWQAGSVVEVTAEWPEALQGAGAEATAVSEPAPVAETSIQAVVPDAEGIVS